MSTQHPASGDQEVPRVDLADFRDGDPQQRRDFCDALRSALVGFGFVRVAGHGIDAALIGEVFSEFEAFFALPEEAKAACTVGEGGQRGYTPFGMEHAAGYATPDLKEFYHVGQELSGDRPRRSQYPENVWPRERPGLRPAAVRLYRGFEAAAGELLEALAFSFALSPGTFSGMLEGGNSILRALHYPPLALAERGGPAYRAAPHEDINLITLLCEASDSGLEILTRDGEWLAVEVGPGEIVADAGDMLARVSNERIPATTHRVVAPAGGEERHRYSLPFFAHPYPECDLSVLPSFVSEAAPARHPPITAEVFLETRLREIGLLD